MVTASLCGPLAGIRVIDIATPLSELASRLLAEMGADVIKVEPPGGAAARKMGPFDRHNGESLYWAAVGMGKRSVVLDLGVPSGRQRFLELVRSSDVLIESFAPGYMASIGLGYDVLHQENPALVMASISAFGQDGPEACSPATDLTLEAAGGLLGLQGDGDRPPVPVGYPQASFHAGAQAAADITFALYERERSGLGQHLDVSAQAAVVWTLMNATGFPPNPGGNPPGTSENRAKQAELFPGLKLQSVWDCADGWVHCHTTLPGIGGRTMQTVMRWVEESGALPEDLHGLDWTSWTGAVASGALTVPQVIAAFGAIQAFFLTKTARELQAFGNETGILLGAIYRVPDLLTDPQLIAREYWREVRGRIHPGPYIRLTNNQAGPPAPAPDLGADQSLLDQPAAPIVRTGSGERRPIFDGLKVADFAWVGVGPIISKALADHGATVVHIESSLRPDVLRLLPPFKDGIPGIDRSQFMADYNSSKLGLALNLATAEGKAAALRLIDWADVVVESFTPGTMARLGFDYETLRKRKPGIVMLSTCLRGQTGPERGYTGFGGQGAALAGLHAITGWPDRTPAGTWGAYSDFIGPRVGCTALGAALLHWQRTGEGDYVDLSQSEAAIHFLEPLVLDYTVNGNIPAPAGHSSIYAAPHGVYQCAGIERYIAVALETDEQWKALCATPGLALDPSLDEAGRRTNSRAIDTTLAEWFASRDAFEASQALRAQGVPAYAVLRPTDLYEDRQLAHREFFVTLDHREMGPTPYDGLITRFSETPGWLRTAAPCLGQDTDYVLREILGMTEDEIIDLAAAEALV